MIERPRGEWLVLGELTVRGVTRPVPLTVRFGGSITDSQGKPRVSLAAHGTLTRSEFGVVAELMEEAGSMRIGDDITLDLEAEATKSTWPPPPPSKLIKASGQSPPLQP